MARWLGTLFGGVIGVALVGAAWVLLQHDPGPSFERSGAQDLARVPVEAGAVRREDLNDVRALNATLEAAVEYDVAAKIAGQLRRVHVDLGDTVRPGDLIAVLDDSEARQAAAESEAGLEVARARLAETESALESAQRELRRTRELRERRIASEAELEAAEARVRAERSRVRSAEAEIAQRQAALASARVRLSFTEIRAEWDGDTPRVVGQRYVDPGATVSAAQPIVSLLEVDRLRAVTFVTERDYGRLRSGQSARLRVDAHPDRVFDAQVFRLAPRFSPGSRQARVELQVPNDDGELRPGMFARVQVDVGRVDEAVTVPRDAVVRRDGQETVFVIRAGSDGEPDRVEQVAVRTGIRAGNRLQIREPELEGAVVTLGQHLLQDGVAVQVVDGGLGEVLGL